MNSNELPTQRILVVESGSLLAWLAVPGSILGPLFGPLLVISFLLLAVVQISRADTATVELDHPELVRRTAQSVVLPAVVDLPGHPRVYLGRCQQSTGLHLSGLELEQAIRAGEPSEDCIVIVTSVVSAQRTALDLFPPGRKVRGTPVVVEIRLDSSRGGFL
jgi:hypothetical protein